MVVVGLPLPYSLQPLESTTLPLTQVTHMVTHLGAGRGGGGGGGGGTVVVVGLEGCRQGG